MCDIDGLTLARLANIGVKCFDGTEMGYLMVPEYCLITPKSVRQENT